jgi:site-specific recombinase XerD
MEKINEFLATVSIYSKKSTVKNYRYCLGLFNDYVNKSPELITSYDVASWVKVLELKYAPTTVSLIVSVAKEFLRDYAPNINTRRIRVRKAHAENPSETLTPEEYVSMLSFVKARTRTGVRNNLILRLLYDTGARIGEIHWFLNNPKHQDRFAIINTEKTSDKRYIAWGEDTQVFLDLWLSFEQPVPTLRQMQRIVKKYAKLAKIEKKITPHSFRHTLAHRILDNGGTVKDISEMLGHKSPISSFHYLRENEQEKLVRQRRWITST